MKFHTITGLPRSGTTLICNILNQNPKFHVSSTSTLPIQLNILSYHWSTSVEDKWRLQIDKKGTEKKYNRILNGIIKNTYEDRKEEVIFDKSRDWTSSSLMLNKISPDSLLIIVVRDLRAIAGSIEKQHLKNPILDEAELTKDKLLFRKMSTLFSDEGLVGLSVIGVEDCIRRKENANVLFIKFEDFIEDPEKWMRIIYIKIGEEYFEHDFDNIKNTSEEPDYEQLYKYPHQGCGKVSKLDPLEYEKYIEPYLASIIMERFPYYNACFEYKIKEDKNDNKKNRRSNSGTRNTSKI